jgi:hypothetical protein
MWPGNTLLRKYLRKVMLCIYDVWRGAALRGTPTYFRDKVDAFGPGTEIIRPTKGYRLPRAVSLRKCSCESRHLLGYGAV